ncbi:hypothetical protein ACVILI_005646 [Mesorhizobium sp. USDA 4775]|uniref:hypothetical protein n=1 Tax=Mesorhizobium jarvisii TaxID=1777867 RepID=UPI00056E1C5A|nr:hypothetical protein [Mesorhizobium jarvisii]MCH4559126.1 hypothetical protein [Mesorhizobium jarvisii]QGU20689.1 hypothetical protein MCHK_09155 [Mesorhizobium huakuii 7653R]
MFRLGLPAILLCLLANQALAGRAFDLVSRLPEPDRLRALQAIIVNAEACTGASKMIYMGDSTDSDAGYWTIRCAEGEYMLEIMNAGDMQTKVMKCSLAEALGIRCWQPF